MGLNFNFSFGFGNEKKEPQPENEEIKADTDKYPGHVSREIQIINEVLDQHGDLLSAAKSKKDDSGNIDGPIVGGRQSVNQISSNMPNLFGEISSDYPFHLLKVLENLVMYNGHISLAVENIVTLANTEIETYFSDQVPSSIQNKMKEHLKIVRNNWYEHSEGVNSLVNDLLTQTAIYGALSGEIVPKDDLSGVSKLVRVSPVNIRFAYDKDKDFYIPLQKVSLDYQQLSSSKYPGYIELNRNTYSYIAYRRIGESPYPIPPFFAAIGSLITESDMMKGFKNAVDKMGVLGFLSVLVSMPKKNDALGESDDAYRNRLIRHLEGLRPQVEAGFSRGVAIGYKNQHEFNLEGSNMNVQGAEGLFKIIKSYTFEGVKQDPNMMGENYSTTETFGRVILAKTTKQMENHQKIVASFLAKAEYMELYLSGFQPRYVEKVFAKAMIGDQKREEETEKIKIENITKKRDEGYIDQDVAAQELGYDKPAAPGRVNPPAGAGSGASGESKGPSNPTPDNQPEDQKETESNNKASRFGLLKLINGNGGLGTPFDYYVPEIDNKKNDHVALDFAPRLNINGVEFEVEFNDDYLENQAGKYTKKVNAQFSKTIEQALPNVKRALESLSDSDSVDTIRQTALFHLLRDWKVNFTNAISGTIEGSIETIYDHYRKDETVFTQSPGFVAGRKFMRGLGFKHDKNQSCFSQQRRESSVKLFAIPEATFELLDYRAIEYSVKLDKYYLGKFITDADTVNRITKWIEQRYLKEGSPVKTKKSINDFVEAFGDKVNLEAWKISRIIDTTVNKVRNMANVNYINQAGVASFEVVEVMDRITCDWCSYMNGKIFDVSKAVEKFEKAMSGTEEDVKNYTPFATTVKIDEFRNMDAATLQSQGFDAPSYHPKCRGRVVANI